MDTRSLGLLYRDKRGKRGEVGEKRRETGSGREEGWGGRGRWERDIDWFIGSCTYHS